MIPGKGYFLVSTQRPQKSRLDAKRALLGLNRARARFEGAVADVRAPAGFRSDEAATIEESADLAALHRPRNEATTIWTTTLPPPLWAGVRHGATDLFTIY